MIEDNGFNRSIFQLFILFSGFEYALTRSPGFVKDPTKKRPPKLSGPAEGDWQKFATELGEDFFKDLKEHPRTSILWKEAPGQWIVTKYGDVLDTSWMSRTAPTDLEKSFEPIKWVRNCVIHGESQGKVPRYMELVEASIKVLRAAEEKCENVSRLKVVLEKFRQARAQDT